MQILVIDTETTFYNNNSLQECIVEIGISEIDTRKNSVKKVYDEVIAYDLDVVYWGKKDDVWIFNNSTLSKEDVDIKSGRSKPIEQVVREVRELVKGKIATAYNVAFDFGKFLQISPWYIDNTKHPRYSDPNQMLQFTLAKCIMLEAAKVCKLPGRFGYKWPSLDEAINILQIKPENYNIDEYTKQVITNPLSRHRAYYDCAYSAMVLLEMIKRREYELPRQKINV